MEEKNFSPEITKLLAQWEAGDAEAAGRMVSAIYHELRQLARQQLRQERNSHTLQPTALVHEAYLRLAGQNRMHWRNRTQFFAVAGQLMRRILVDHARARMARKRGGHAERVQLEEALVPVQERAAELLALDAALKELAQINERKSRVVELRFFAGLTIEETAQAMGLNAATVRRDWTFAKAWLHRALLPASEGTA